MRSTILFPLCVLAVACGDNGDTLQPPDAPPRPDAAPDASLVIPCAYTEMNDTTNDDLFGTGSPENTGISFSTKPTAICGKFNMGHYVSNRIDVDSFKFTVPANTRGIVHLTAPGAENLDLAFLEIYAVDTNIDETGEFVGNFAVAAAPLPPGDYVITVSAYDGADLTANLDYKLTLEVDAPRCQKSMTAANFTEAGETTAGGGNDVLEVTYGQPQMRSLTALSTDAPEATNITVAAGMSYHVTGANSTFTVTPVSWADSFQDRDTYAIKMGPATNQLAIRLNWPGTTADFDFLVFPENSTTDQAEGWYNLKMEDEFTTLAVTPGATYWVFVGADDSSTGQPINYDLTVCGDTYTP